MTAPALTGLLETALYVDDVKRSVDFYQRIFEFETLFISERGAALGVAGAQVLLLFKKGGSLEPIVNDAGTIPPHDGSGQLHMAFSIPAAALGAWEDRLEANGVEIKARYHWPLGGQRIYFDDIDGHLIELVTPRCWKVY